MTNERRNNLGLKRMLFTGALGFGLIGFGDAVGNIPANREIIENIEYPAKAIGYLFAGGSSFVIAGASLMAGGKKLGELYKMSCECRED